MVGVVGLVVGASKMIKKIWMRKIWIRKNIPGQVLSTGTENFSVLSK
jgi:hypothetical protein